METEVTLPELAEGVEKGDVISVLVKEGDEIGVDDPVIEVQSEKATLTVPSTAGGKVTKVLVKSGDSVKIGQVLISVAGENGAAAEPRQAEGAPKQEDVSQQKESAEDKRPPAPKDSTSQLKPDARQEKAASAPTDQKGAAGTTGDKADADAPPDPRSAGERIDQNDEPPAPIRSGKQGAGAPGGPRKSPGYDFVPAGPAVRRIARELGIDLNTVRGSGRNGRIVVEDLQPHIRGYVARTGGATGFAAPPIELPDFSKWGPVRKERADSIRRKISEKMTQAWTSIPHVHQFHEADVTDLLSLLGRHKERVKKSGGALTFTVFALKAVAAALKEFPQFNASFDAAAGEIIYKDYFHIGVAVDTDSGLIVPVIRDVDKKPIVQLSKELQEIAQKGRDKKISIEEMRGGTFTISNLGGIGGSHFTPIINSPEVAILGIGRSGKRPMFAEDGTITGRDIAPLVLGYDHRVIDGADGARFLVRIADILENFEATFLGL